MTRRAASPRGGSPTLGARTAHDALAALLALAALGASACERPARERPTAGEENGGPRFAWDVVQDSSDRLAHIEGFQGPGAVRYDPDQDVWFVSNLNGPGGERDNNGFISRIAAQSATVESLRFAEGSAERPLHAPRGMCLQGDTLWVVDLDGIHGFDRRSGDRLAFVDLARFEPGQLNDVALGPDGALYVTDTEKSAVYRVSGGDAALALADPALGNPDGIAWDEARGALVLVPWQAGSRVHLWRPGAGLEPFGPRWTPGGLAGVESLDRRLLVASERDSSLVLMDAGTARPVIRTPGPPGDLGVDPRRRRVAVPYVGLNRVDLWALPPE